MGNGVIYEGETGRLNQLNQPVESTGGQNERRVTNPTNLQTSGRSTSNSHLATIEEGGSLPDSSLVTRG